MRTSVAPGVVNCWPTKSEGLSGRGSPPRKFKLLRSGYWPSRHESTANHGKYRKYDKTIGIPDQQLDAIAATIPKNEEMTAQRIFLKHALDEMRKSVESFAHVGRFPSQDNADGWRQAQHRRASSTARTAPSAIGSKPRMTRTVGPAGSTISIGVVAAIGSAASRTTRTGKNAERTGDSAFVFGCPTVRAGGISRSRRANSRRHQWKFQVSSPSR